MELDAQPVTPEGFAPFGRVLGFDDCDPSERVVARYRHGQEPMPSIISEVNPDGVPRCGWLARHHDQTQALTPIDGPILLVLAPPGTDPLTAEGRGAARAFVADVGEGIQLDEGVWHWAASVQRGSVRVANLQGHRWPEDNEIASIEEVGVLLAPRHPRLDQEWAADLLAVGTAAILATGRGRPRPDRTASTAGPSARRVAGETIWVVVDADGAVELAEPDVLDVVRSRPA